ncbi:hypothetical protein A6A04_12300 [Paramagnetospirillum marisnigri]|uniref:Uncharacterized protein n=1 Tax=Paramagnetospirillum marisnigri TaxID=1285242 RepID=A0A178MUR0_9PROT|nr:hypothetical protein A6A04_12300 [Paramagnetospirillum marisnigri]
MSVVCLPRMFRDERITGTIPPGWSIDEIVGQMVADHAIHPLIIPGLRVYIRDDKRERDSLVPYDRWRFVRPKAGAAVIIKAVPLGGGGGGGGGKSPVKMIAMLAVMAVAAVATAGIGSAIMGVAGAAPGGAFAVGGIELATSATFGVTTLTSVGTVVAGLAGGLVPMIAPAAINMRIPRS